MWKFFQKKWLSQDWRINKDRNRAKINITALVPTNLIHCISQHCFFRALNVICRAKVLYLYFPFVWKTQSRICKTMHHKLWYNLWVIHISTPALARLCRLWVITLDKGLPCLDLWRWKHGTIVHHSMDYSWMKCYFRSTQLLSLILPGFAKLD